jgi:hypothetical protein
MRENNEVHLSPRGSEELDAMPGLAASSITKSDQKLLRVLQRRALRYFLENQGSHGLVQDRQSNFGPTRQGEPLSISATGMGLIAIALASADPYRLISREESILRVRQAILTGLHRVPSDRGILPHFVSPENLQPLGEDAFSTVDSSWVVAGALWAFVTPDLSNLPASFTNGSTGITGQRRPARPIPGKFGTARWPTDVFFHVGGIVPTARLS